MAYKLLPKYSYLQEFYAYLILFIFLAANVLGGDVNAHVLLFGQRPFHFDRLLRMVLYKLFKAFGKPIEL